MGEQVTVEAAAISLSEGEMTQEREARLLEVGSYPDKGLTVTEADLEGIVARFGAASAGDVPVKVEHVDTPLDPLGQVKTIWREGGALMGRLAFPPDLAGFLRRRGVQKLSVGLTREPLSLAEVSLVLKPRVAAAAMFGEPTPAASGDPSLLGKGEERKGEEGLTMGDERDAEIVRLRAELTQGRVEAQIGQLKAAGRVVPATEGLVRALLSAPGENLITLSEGGAAEPVAGVFLRFLKAMPPVVKFMDMAPGAAASASDPATPGIPQLSEEEQAWLRDKLGLDPAQVLEMMLTGKLTTSATGGAA